VGKLREPLRHGERLIMERVWRLFCALIVALSSITGSAAIEPQRPNVIIILTDDQGTIDARCFGARDLETPNIDALAKHGVRFTQFYAAAAVCSPSRAGLLTGRYPLRTGLIGNAGSHEGGVGMSSSEVTIAETLKASGYVTAHFGKWHLGYRPETMPNGQGFDQSFGHMGGCIDNYSHFFYWAGPNIHDLHQNTNEVFYNGQFFPDLIVKQAAEFMAKNKKRPFFIYFAMNNPHYPYQPDPKWLKHYRNSPYPRNLYAAFVSTMDERIGGLLKQVDRLGLREKTIVIFQSDHGHSTEERAHFGGGSAGPYRGAKFSLFEGGIRVPAIISWPGHLPENAVRDQVAHGCDWFPTIAQLCGARLLNPDIDGRSLVEVAKLAASPSPHSVLHWYMGTEKEPQWAVREGDWKLIGNPRDTTKGEEKAKIALAEADKKLFLVNLKEDPSERHNLAKEQPAILTHLQELHTNWVRVAKPAQLLKEPGKGNE
jgi:arylsulfatase A